MTWALRMARTARNVSSSGSPGPTPTRRRVPSVVMWGSWFGDRPLGDGKSGTQDALAADGVEAGDIDADELAAEAGLAGIEGLFGIEGDGIGDEAAAGAERGPAGVEQRFIGN